MGLAGFVLEFVATVCSFGALALFVFWLIGKSSDSYNEGLVVLERLDVSNDTSPEKLFLPPIINRVIIALLSIIENLQRPERLGLIAHLTDWERKLIQSDLRSQMSPQQMLALSLLLGFAVTLLSLIFALMLGFGLGFTVMLLLPATAVLGFHVPKIVLNNTRKNRISLIEKRLPFAIEFMLLSMEARASFPAAIEIYCNQMASDPLADELRKVLRDIERGMNTEEALSNLAARLQSDDISAFALAVNTGLATGQPIKDILQVQADVTRARRYQSAEQIAKTASTRAIFPLFIVAMAVVLLLIGPLVIRMMQHSLF